MASFTTPTIHATGDVLSVSDFNAVANNTTFLFQAPAANVFNSVATPLGTGTVTPVTLGGTTLLNYGFSVASNNLVIPIAGVYWLSGQVAAAVGTGVLASVISLQGANVAQANTLNNAATSIPFVGTVQSCSAANTVGLEGFSSTSVSSSPGANLTFLAAFFIGSQ